jgi:hypothetical protein
MGKKRKRRQRRSERGARLKVVDLFRDERLTEAVLEFLKDTEIGRRYLPCEKGLVRDNLLVLDQRLN